MDYDSPTIRYKRIVSRFLLDESNINRTIIRQHVEEDVNRNVAVALIEYLRTHRGLPKKPNHYIISYNSYWENDPGYDRTFVAEISLQATHYKDVVFCIPPDLNTSYINFSLRRAKEKHPGYLRESAGYALYCQKNIAEVTKHQYQILRKEWTP